MSSLVTNTLEPGIFVSPHEDFRMWKKRVNMQLETLDEVEEEEIEDNIPLPKDSFVQKFRRVLFNDLGFITASSSLSAFYYYCKNTNFFERFVKEDDFLLPLASFGIGKVPRGNNNVMYKHMKDVVQSNLFSKAAINEIVERSYMEGNERKTQLKKLIEEKNKEKLFVFVKSNLTRELLIEVISPFVNYKAGEKRPFYKEHLSLFCTEKLLGIDTYFAKRRIDSENMVNYEKEWVKENHRLFNFFENSENAVTIPREIMIIIFSFIKKGRHFFDNVAVVNYQWYIISLESFCQSGILEINSHNLLLTPFFILTKARNISCSGSLLRKEKKYVLHNIKSAKMIDLSSWSYDLLFLPQYVRSPMENVRTLNTGCEQYFDLSWLLPLFPNLRVLKCKYSGWGLVRFVEKVLWVLVKKSFKKIVITVPWKSDTADTFKMENSLVKEIRDFLQPFYDFVVDDNSKNQIFSFDKFNPLPDVELICIHNKVTFKGGDFNGYLEKWKKLQRKKEELRKTRDKWW